MSLKIFPLALFAGLHGLAPAAEPLPLSTSYWKDASFLRAFNGSYRIEARIEPNVSSAERGLLVDIQKLLENGQRKQALTKLKDSGLAADSAAISFNLGNLHFEEGELDAAAQAYRQAIEKYPSFRRAHRNLGMVLARQDKIEEALPELIEAVRLGDSDGATYGLLAHCRLQQGHWASALQAYRMAQVSDPDEIEWKAGVAQCLQHLEAPAEAVALLDEVIAKRPQEPGYAELQANILIEAGRQDDAIKALELPRRLKLLDGDGLLLLAELNLRENHPGEALALADEAYAGEKKPGPGRALSTLNFACARHEWEVAEKLLERIKETPQDPAPRALRLAEARLAIDSGTAPDKGAETLRELIREDPLDGQALMMLGRHEAGAGKPGEGELLLERAAAVEETAAEAWVEIARLRVGQTRYAAALKAVDEALKLQPGGQLQDYRRELAHLVDAAK